MAGAGVLAEALPIARDHGETISVDPPPAYFPLDLTNDWMLDRFIRELARVYSLGEVDTDYRPRDEDAPPEVREYMASCRKAARSGGTPGVVY